MWSENQDLRISKEIIITVVVLLQFSLLSLVSVAVVEKG